MAKLAAAKANPIPPVSHGHPSTHLSISSACQINTRDNDRAQRPHIISTPSKRIGRGSNTSDIAPRIMPAAAGIGTVGTRYAAYAVSNAEQSTTATMCIFRKLRLAPGKNEKNGRLNGCSVRCLNISPITIGSRKTDPTKCAQSAGGRSLKRRTHTCAGKISQMKNASGRIA
jgi:hypothetical protein